MRDKARVQLRKGMESSEPVIVSRDCLAERRSCLILAYKELVSSCRGLNSSEYSHPYRSIGQAPQALLVEL